VPVVAAYHDDAYDVVLVLHILCAIVGFGAVYLNGVYGAEIRKRRGSDAIAIYDANFRVSKIGEYLIYGVFISGFALVGMSDSVVEFSQTWVWLSIALFVIALGLSHGVLLPAERRMGVLLRETASAGRTPAGAAGPPPQAAEMARLGKRIGVTGVTLNLFVVVILVLMVWRPGGP
jgi:hypothetical protein